MFDITGLNAEEFDLVTKALRDYREEKERQEVIEAHKNLIEELVSSTIDAIGFDETKHIMQKIAKDLRNQTNDPCDNCEQCVEMQNGVHAKCPKTGLFDECEKLYFLSNFS